MGRTRTIDVHSHVLPSSYVDALARAGVDPAEEDGFPSPSWNPEAHCTFVDEAGIDFSIVTISSPHIHQGDDAAACAAARAINDETAAFCAESPERFGFCAVLPTPCIDGSVEEARRALDQLGALGVKLPSNSHGVYLGDARFAPLYEFLESRGCPAIIHPTSPQEVPEGAFTSGPKPLLEFIADTTRSAIDLIVSGVLLEYPRIRFVIPHCGSFLPLLANRLEGISHVLAQEGKMSPVDVDESISHLYFDTAGSPLPAGLETLMHITTPDKILFGSDYPYTPAGQIEAAADELFESGIAKPMEERLRHGNAEELFGI